MRRKFSWSGISNAWKISSLSLYIIDLLYIEYSKVNTLMEFLVFFLKMHYKSHDWLYHLLLHIIDLLYIEYSTLAILSDGFLYYCRYVQDCLAKVCVRPCQLSMLCNLHWAKLRRLYILCTTTSSVSKTTIIHIWNTLKLFTCDFID